VRLDCLLDAATVGATATVGVTVATPPLRCRGRTHCVVGVGPSHSAPVLHDAAALANVFAQSAEEANVAPQLVEGGERLVRGRRFQRPVASLEHVENLCPRRQRGRNNTVQQVERVRRREKARVVGRKERVPQHVTDCGLDFVLPPGCRCAAGRLGDERLEGAMGSGT
jgi:hypothetical protein